MEMFFEFIQNSIVFKVMQMYNLKFRIMTIYIQRRITFILYTQIQARKIIVIHNFMISRCMVKFCIFDGAYV